MYIENLGFIQGVSKKISLLKMLTKENLLATDCKPVLRAVSVLTFGSFTLYNYNFTIVYFSKKLYRRLTRYLNRFRIISYPSRYVVIK